MTTNRKVFNTTVLLLMIVPLFLLTWKMYNGYFTAQQFLPETTYQVDYNFELNAKDLDKDLFVKTYIPQNTPHQKIENFVYKANDFNVNIDKTPIGKQIEWRSEQEFPNTQHIQCSFAYTGKSLQYDLANNLPLQQIIPEEVRPYLEASEFIQSDNMHIIRKANDLITADDDLTSALKNIYKYVRLIPAIQTNELTDALTTLEKRSASCNGKSRLFTALCRAKGIPARVVGGIILQTAQKKTSHLWAEAYVQGQWIPFDALNGHLAYLPSNYMELYKGDYFLISRTANIDFDYQYHIRKHETIAQNVKSDYTLWALPLQAGIPIDVLKLILLLPICSLLVALLKNVIGIKSFGVFLPAIMAMAMDGIGFLYGSLAFVVVVAVVSFLHYPLNKWGLLYTPKLVVLIIGVVLSLLLTTYIGIQFNNITLSSMVFFPIIVLTIAAERFARTIVEDGMEDALQLQAQTLVVTFFCYLVYNCDFLTGFFLTCPEVYAMIIALVLLIGQWIGIRISEYRRFEWVVS